MMSEVTGEILQYHHGGVYYQMQVSAYEIRLFVDGKVILELANMGSMLATKHKDTQIAELESAITGLLERPCVDGIYLETQGDEICAYCHRHFSIMGRISHKPDCKYAIARKLVGGDGE